MQRQPIRSIFVSENFVFTSRHVICCSEVTAWTRYRENSRIASSRDYGEESNCAKSVSCDWRHVTLSRANQKKLGDSDASEGSRDLRPMRNASDVRMEDAGRPQWSKGRPLRAQWRRWQEKKESRGKSVRRELDFNWQFGSVGRRAALSASLRLICSRIRDGCCLGSPC